MAKVSLKSYLNAELKKKGIGVKAAQKNADKYSSIKAAKKAGSLYYTNKSGKIMAAVYAEDLTERPKLRPKKVELKKPAATRAKEGSGKQHKRSKVFTAEGEAKKLQTDIANAAAKKLASSKAFAAKVAAVRAEGNIEDGKTATVTPVTAMSEGASKAVDRSGTNTQGRPTNPAALKRYLAAQEGKNKGGMIMKKKKTGYAAGGMAAKKKPATAKMMGGGMMAAKKKGSTMYNKGGAAKKR